MKLKLDDAGHAVIKDGMPVYTHEDGTDVPFDVVKTIDNIKTLRHENTAHRKGKETAEERLRAFEGIDDVDAAKAALATVSKIDAKKLIDAGQVDVVKAEVNKAWETKYGALEKERDGLKGELYGEKVGGSFARSKFVTERLIYPPEHAQKIFGDHFKVEGGKIKAVDSAGAPIYSRKSPGSEADFDEALEILVDALPHKDQILKADNKSGSGAPANQGGGTAGKKTISRPAFEALDPQARVDHMKSGGAVTD